MAENNRRIFFIRIINVNNQLIARDFHLVWNELSQSADQILCYFSQSNFRLGFWRGIPLAVRVYQRLEVSFLLYRCGRQILWASSRLCVFRKMVLPCFLDFQNEIPDCLRRFRIRLAVGSSRNSIFGSWTMCTG